MWASEPGFARSGDILVLNRPPGAVKMSEMLIELVKPEWASCDDHEDEMRKLLTIGVAAWNAALLKGAERTAFLKTLAQTFPTELRSDFFTVVEPYIRRKEKLFPHIQRPIINFELTWTTDNEPYVSVLSGFA